MKKVKLKTLRDLITEKDIQRVCRDYLLVKGWFVFHLLQGLGCYPGLTDMVAIKDGRVLFIEYKRPGRSKQSGKQEIFQADIERAGGEYYLIRSLEEVIKILGGKEVK
jgi:hypothetical protein